MKNKSVQTGLIIAVIVAIIALIIYSQKKPAGVSKTGDVKVGIILGFTGPIESLTPAMAASAELAFKEVSDSGSLLGGVTITPSRADSTCVDSAAATSAAEGLVSQEIGRASCRERV